MPRARSEEPRSRQVLMRLTESEHAVLAAMAYLEGVTPTELASERIVGFLEVAAKSDRVERVVRERREHEAEREGRLATLAAERGKRSGPGPAS